MAESTGSEGGVRVHRNHRSEITLVSEHRRGSRRRPRQPEESSQPHRHSRRLTPTSSGKKSYRRRQRTGHGSSSAVSELSRIMSSSRESRARQETCIDLTVDTLPPTPAVVDLTDTSVQLRKNEPMRRDSSDVEITGTVKSRTPPAKSYVRCPVCLEMGSEFMAAGRDIVSTKCGHVFCDLCLRQAIEDSRRCPTCRTTLRMKDFHKLYL